MADRFQKVFSLSPNLYTENCPIIIEAGALQKDTETGNIIAQIKMCNIGDVPVSSCKVSLKAFENNGEEVEGVTDYSYMDLNATRGTEFGAKVPVMLPNRSARSFSVDITEIVFTDGTVKKYNDNQWKPVPEQRTIDETLQDAELVKQYKAEVGKKAAFMPEKQGGLFRCACGAINLDSAETCYKCGNSYEKLTACLDQDYLIGKIEEKKKQAEIEKENNQKKKKTIIKVIAAIVICGIVAAGIFTVIKQRKHVLDKTAIDYEEPDKVVKSVKVGDAEFNLTNDWYCYENINEKDVNVSYLFYPEGKPENNTSNVAIIGNYFYNLVDPDVFTYGNAADSVQMSFDAFEKFYAANGFKVVEKNRLTRDGMPAYYIKLHHDEAKADQDIYMFVANKSDIVITVFYANDKAKKDYTKEYLEMVRGIKTDED